eukprot:g11701.t1
MAASLLHSQRVALRSKIATYQAAAEAFADGFSVVLPCWVAAGLAFSGLNLKRKRESVEQGARLFRDRQQHDGAAAAKDVVALRTEWWRSALGQNKIRVIETAEGAGARIGLFTFAARKGTSPAIPTSRSDEETEMKTRPCTVYLHAVEEVSPRPGAAVVESRQGSSDPKQHAHEPHRDVRILAYRTDETSAWKTRGVRFWAPEGFGAWIRRWLPEVVLPTPPATFLVAQWKVVNVDVVAEADRPSAATHLHAQASSRYARNTGMAGLEKQEGLGVGMRTRKSKSFGELFSVLCCAVAVGSMAHAWWRVGREAYARKRALDFVRGYVAQTGVLAEMRSLVAGRGGDFGSALAPSASSPAAASLCKRPAPAQIHSKLPAALTTAFYNRPQSSPEGRRGGRKRSRPLLGPITTTDVHVQGRATGTEPAGSANGVAEGERSCARLTLENGSVQESRIDAVFQVVDSRVQGWYRLSAWRHPFNKEWNVTEAKLLY